jgi:general secretion pathway protein G
MSRSRTWCRARNRRGTSLVEVMVVIAIITTLMGIIGYGVMRVWQNSQVDTTILTMGEVNKRIELYTLKKGIPSTSDGLSAVYGDERPLKDAWGNDFVFVSPGPDGADYDLISYGRDGVEGGDGLGADISWAQQQNQ